MLVLELHDIEVDYCPETGGIWLDAGELELLLGSDEAARAVLDHGEPAGQSRERRYPCPICGTRMRKWSLGDGLPIIYDKCPEGHGMWFDRGELRQVLRHGDDTPRAREVVALLNDMFPMNTPEGAGSPPGND
jgi:hypothetical protein